MHNNLLTCNSSQVAKVQDGNLFTFFLIKKRSIVYKGGWVPSQIAVYILWFCRSVS